jgi:hypothetical protein
MFWRSVLLSPKSSAALDYLMKTGNYLTFSKVQRLRRLETSTSIFVVEIYLENPWI